MKAPNKEEKNLDDAFFKQADRRLKKRLSPQRYKHSKSVSSTAVKLAKIYGVDEVKARLAGLLHDWDKCYDDKAIRSRAQELRVGLATEAYETIPGLLHGVTAAAALLQEFPELDKDVLQAIERHTAGDIGMTDLDMVVYVADVIEPGRPYRAMDKLRESVGKVSLIDLFFATYKHVFMHLIDEDYRIHPDTVRVWNHYVQAIRTEQEKKGTQ